MSQTERKVLSVGVMPHAQQVKRTIAIARGEYKPKANEPKVWFSSMASLSQVLSDENQRLLRIIAEHKPKSLRELEEQSGRARSNLSRTLKTMECIGLVKLTRVNRKLVPEAKATAFEIKAGDWGFSERLGAKSKTIDKEVST